MLLVGGVRGALYKVVNDYRRTEKKALRSKTVLLVRACLSATDDKKIRCGAKGGMKFGWNTGWTKGKPR